MTTLNRDFPGGTGALGLLALGLLVACSSSSTTAPCEGAPCAAATDAGASQPFAFGAQLASLGFRHLPSSARTAART